MRCKKRITACGSTAETLFHAPIEMLHHLGMIANFEVIDESGLKAMPLLFNGLDCFTRSKRSYEESVGDEIDDELAPKCFNSELSIDQQFSLCEAIKVDAFQSEDNGDTISSTLSLIKVLFEDLQLWFEIHHQFKENTPKDIDVNGTKFFLLNWTSTTQGGYRFDHQLLKKDGINPIKKEAFKLLQAFCIFGYQEFYKKLLFILLFTHQRNHGKESLVPMQILKMFKRLDNEPVIEHLKRHFIPTCPLSFDHLFSINDDTTVHCTKNRPIQFKFGKVNDMLTFYNKQGEGWTNIQINKYFSGGVQQMTTSQQFEEAYIQFETTRQIKVEKISNEYKFSIKCVLENFQANNSTLRARHQKMFKKDTYEFEPIKELVLMMHFGFIDSLKKGWNHIYKGWLEKMKQHLKNAGDRLIKQICLKQLTGIFNLDSLVKKIRLTTEKNDLQEEIKDKDEDKKTTILPDWDKVIYDIVQTNSHKFSVKYSQISDIIGEEEWVDGEMNTSSNIGSHQIVNLSFGALKKRKITPRDF